MQFVGNFVFIFCISAILFFSISVKSDLYLWESAADRGGDPSVLVGAAAGAKFVFHFLYFAFQIILDGCCN